MRLPLALYTIRLAAALLLAYSVGTSAVAQTAVDLQLVLAVDASGSVDQQRFELQMQGYVAAFRDPRVLYAIQAGTTQAIAVTMVQWTGPALQIQVLPWTLIKDATTAQRMRYKVGVRRIGDYQSTCNKTWYASTMSPP